VDVDDAGLDALAEALPGDALVTAELDVTDAAGWERVVAATAARTGGRLDVLVNNAGVLAAGPFADLPLARQLRLVDVNLGGVVTGCAAAFPYLQRGSCVVNLASASALYGQPGLAVYSATKAAVCALTEALDLEWQRHGIRVVDVLPLFVETGMVREAAEVRSLRTLGVHLTPQDVAAGRAPRRRRPQPRARTAPRRRPAGAGPGGDVAARPPGAAALAGRPAGALGALADHDPHPVLSPLRRRRRDAAGDPAAAPAGRRR
jgi:NAD(P)-dependent dehydrogenase (short-subunit alcohol dehydrogenase family)